MSHGYATVNALSGLAATSFTWSSAYIVGRSRLNDGKQDEIAASASTAQASGQTLVFDLGTAQALVGIVLLGHNLATGACTVTVEGADNAAITAYVEARFPQPPLLGRTPAEKAEIASWNWRVEFEGLMAIAEALRNSAPAMAGRALPGPVDYPQIPALAERGLVRVQQFFFMLDERLAGRDFVAGAEFSVADITALVAVDFARVLRLRPGEQHPQLLRWRAAMALRPSMALQL